jgi:hypothetical protein
MKKRSKKTVKFLFPNLDPLISTDSMNLRTIHVVSSDGREEIRTCILWADIVGVGLWF